MQYTKHLQIRNNTYHFRFKIPTELKSLTSKSEIVRSLKTDSFNDACVIIATKLPLLRQLKNMTSEQTTRNELQDLFDELIDFTDIDNYNRYQRFATSDETQGIQTVEDQVRSDLQDNNKTDFSDLTRTQPSIDIKSHKDFQRLFVRLLEAKSERAMHGCTPEFEGLLSRAQSMLTPSVKPKYLLSEQYEKFKAFKGWTDKVTKDNNRYFLFLVSHWGDICVTTITKQHIKKALDAYKCMPLGNQLPYKNMSVKQRYLFSVNDIDAMHEDDFVSSKTVHGLLTIMQSFLVHT
ncbi:DUF6538 domain-containing protein [Psychromonas ingrahamii]|uniref:DUF6538 domain-containing protein n=1 Tax=Psychromonas ingrahamii TaxID=357794 RepID=UPI0000D803B9|nr:DUF6538 domain-containing protein [Psychromonas ingrahamii]